MKIIQKLAKKIKSQRFQNEGTNGYWVFENGNKYSCWKYSYEQAEQLSKTLINCSDCIDCVRCENCISCVECADCYNCKGCSICDYCESCICCIRCKNCINCEKCFKCKFLLEVKSTNWILEKKEK